MSEICNDKGNFILNDKFLVTDVRFIRILVRSVHKVH